MKVLDYVIPVLNEHIYHKRRDRFNSIVTFVGEITEHETKEGAKYLRYHIYMRCEAKKRGTFDMVEGVETYKVWVDDGNCSSLRDGMSKVIKKVLDRVKHLKQQNLWGS